MTITSGSGLNILKNVYLVCKVIKFKHLYRIFVNKFDFALS